MLIITMFIVNPSFLPQHLLSGVEQQALPLVPLHCALGPCSSGAPQISNHISLKCIARVNFNNSAIAFYKGKSSCRGWGYTSTIPMLIVVWIKMTPPPPTPPFRQSMKKQNIEKNADNLSI